MPWNFYDIATGTMMDLVMHCDEAQAIRNMPAGCAHIFGVFDRLSQRIDPATRQVVDYQPAAPAGDANRTWEWDTQTRRWTAAPTLAALKALRIAKVQAAIEAQEKSQDRPQRELMSAFRVALPAPVVALNRMLAIDNEITRLRTLRSACAAASTKAQLDAVPRP